MQNVIVTSIRNETILKSVVSGSILIWCWVSGSVGWCSVSQWKTCWWVSGWLLVDWWRTYWWVSGWLLVGQWKTCWWVGGQWVSGWLLVVGGLLVVGSSVICCYILHFFKVPTLWHYNFIGHC